MNIDVISFQVVVISDASFANTLVLRNQLGYIVFMAYDKRRANIVHYGSSRCGRVTRSVMVAETHAVIHAVDVGMLIRDVLKKLLGQSSEMEAYVYSGTLLDALTKNSKTAERRL